MDQEKLFINSLSVLDTRKPTQEIIDWMESFNFTSDELIDPNFVKETISSIIKENVIGNVQFNVFE